MDPAQLLAREKPVDAPLTDAEADEMAPRNDAVLTPRQLRDRRSHAPTPPKPTAAVGKCRVRRHTGNDGGRRVTCGSRPQRLRESCVTGNAQAAAEGFDSSSASRRRSSAWR